MLVRFDSLTTRTLPSRKARLAGGALALVAFAAVGIAQSASRPIPSIEKKGDSIRLLVDGSPYLMLGGQVHNSDTANADDLNKALDVLASWHSNTAEVPIYWEAIEPKQGQFDFSSVDLAIQAARKRDLHLVFLWFGTWKNGESHYVPEWMKRDRQKYVRVQGARGEETEIISPLCRAAMEADSHAFAALLAHVKSVDESERTVLMVQVENEPGLVGTDRDYSEAANHLFDGPVPKELLSFLESHRQQLSAPMASIWNKSPKSGTWKQVFGELAPESFSAWVVSNYINTVAAAGKHEYSLPMYVNVWLIEGVERAGRWPSGGATVHVLDIWKAAAPSIDVLAPDIYYPKFYDVAAQYRRPDNPLFVPETNFNPYFIGFAYTTFGYFNGIGFSPFGIDDALKGGAPAAIGAGFEDTYSVLRPMLPIIASQQYTGKLHPVLQGLANGEDWKQSIRVGDHLAANIEFTAAFDPAKGRACGMIIELGPDDFIVMGTGFDVTFREMEGPLRDAQLISIDEGTFQGLQWVPSRRLNGDERHVSLPDKSTILRVRVAR
jgi:beta-galactosidase GanA